MIIIIIAKLIHCHQTIIKEVDFVFFIAKNIRCHIVDLLLCPILTYSHFRGVYVLLKNLQLTETPQGASFNSEML